MRNNLNLINIVELFQEAVNSHDVDKVLTLFTDDALFEIAGLSKFLGKQQVKTIFEYDIGVNTELKFINCKVHGNTVSGQLLERNDRLDAIGFGELKYSSCTFIFRDNQIQSFTAEIPAEFVQYNNQVWQRFLPWLTENHPDEQSKMFTPAGRFNYNRENGANVVRLLREWRKGQEK
jgi:limonene-1,2-epoxide hydrolase